MENYGLVHDSAELRKLMQEHPGCPIVVLADEESASADYCCRLLARPLRHGPNP